MLHVSPLPVRVTGRLVITVVVAKTLCYWLSTAARDAVHQSACRTLPVLNCACWTALAGSLALHYPYPHSHLLFLCFAVFPSADLNKYRHSKELYTVVYIVITPRAFSPTLVNCDRCFNSLKVFNKFNLR